MQEKDFKGSKKINILFYTGHDELIGGDVHYIFDIINNLNQKKFSVELLTDVNRLFNERASSWLKRKDISITYINTRPVLFKKNKYDEYYLKLKYNCDALKGISRIIYNFLNISLGSIKIYNLTRILIRMACLHGLRKHVRNVYVFYRILKKRKGNIDVFHVNNGGYPGKQACLIAIIVAHFFKVPTIILTVHNLAMEKNYFKPAEYIFDYCIPRYCSKIISASDKVREEIIKARTFPTEKIFTIRCGLADIYPRDNDEIKEKKSPLDIDIKRPLLIISGNYEEERKGHVQLFEAIQKVKKKFSNVLLLIAGSGSYERLIFLKNLAKKLNIENNILFLGYRTDIIELYSIVDIAVTPSICKESIPYTIIEAMRAGKAVITTSAGGCSEAVIDKVTGFVVESNNVEELAKRIITLLSDINLCSCMGKAGREYFLKEFLIEHKVAEHEKLYLQ